MNISYISNSEIPSRTANSIHTMKMCEAYAALGHVVTLVVPKWKNEDCNIDDVHAFYGVDHNFSIQKVPLPWWRNLDSFHRGFLMPLMAFSRRPDFVHSRGLTAAWGATKLFGIPTIYEAHQTLPPNSRMETMLMQITRSSHLLLFVTITRALADFMQPYLPNTLPVFIAPDGVQSAWLQQNRSAQEARNPLGLVSEKRRIAVYTGHLYAGRGIELIIELSTQLEDHLFLIVGGAESDIQRFSAATSSLSNLRFVGFKPPGEVQLYLQAADVLLMPYADRVITEGGGDTSAYASPMKMFEYMAAGRPIVASNLPVLQEVLTDGKNAIFCNYKEPDVWISALRRLQTDASFAQALAHQARQDVAQYTWENRAKLLLARCGCVG